MPGEVRTERGEFLFKLREVGQPDLLFSIAAEPRNTTTLLGESANLFFSLSTKNAAEAQHIADFLNKNIESVDFAIFEDHPMYGAKKPA